MNRIFLTVAVLAFPVLALADDPAVAHAGAESPASQEDLLTPMIKDNSAGVILWYRGIARRNCVINDVSVDGETVTFSSDAGDFKADWNRLPQNIRTTLQPKYDWYYAQKQQEVADMNRQVQDQMDKDRGISTVKGKVVSVNDQGLVIAVEDKSYFLEGYSAQTPLAAEDDIGPVRVRLTTETFPNVTVTGSQSTLQVLKYAGDGQ